MNYRLMLEHPYERDVQCMSVNPLGDSPPSHYCPMLLCIVLAAGMQAAVVNMGVVGLVAVISRVLEQ